MLLISEWWASETAVMMGGLLPDAQRQLSAMAIYQTTNAMCFMLPLGIAVAVSTRWVDCCYRDSCISDTHGHLPDNQCNVFHATLGHCGCCVHQVGRLLLP